MRVRISLTPFQVKPNVDVEVLSEGGKVVTGASVVETAHKDLEMVLHLPAWAPEGMYTVRAVLYHSESSRGDTKDIHVEVGQGAGHA